MSDEHWKSMGDNSSSTGLGLRKDWLRTARIQLGLLKAGVGYDRGPKAGHKYWRRVRVMHRGKLAWKYYYNTPKDRAEWAERMKKKIKRKTKRVAKIAAKHEAADIEHGLTGEFRKDHPELMRERKALRDLTVDFVNELTGWEKTPNIVISPKAMEEYGKAVEEAYAQSDDGEPMDLYGQQHHVLRMLEIGMKALPPTIKEHFSGCLKDLHMGFGAEDDYTKRKKSVAGYSDPQNDRIWLALDRVGMDGKKEFGNRPRG